MVMTSGCLDSGRLILRRKFLAGMCLSVAVTLQDQVSAEIAVTLELTRARAPKAKGASRNY